MTDRQIKVGDVVEWRLAPMRALVRDSVKFVWTMSDAEEWQTYEPLSLVTIIALDVPADATADDLRVLAERFEVREAVMRDASLWANEFTLEDLEDAVVTLHRAGWKPGMTAEDAARLLAVHDRGRLVRDMLGCRHD